MSQRDVIAMAAGEATTKLVTTWSGEAYVAYVLGLFEAEKISPEVMQSLIIRAQNLIGDVHR